MSCQYYAVLTNVNLLEISKQCVNQTRSSDENSPKLQHRDSASVTYTHVHTHRPNLRRKLRTILDYW